MRWFPLWFKNAWGSKRSACWIKTTTVSINSYSPNTNSGLHYIALSLSFLFLLLLSPYLPNSLWSAYHHHLIIYPLTARFIRAPQMLSQSVSSIFPCSPLPSGTCRTPDLSISWCCLPTSSSVCLVFFPHSLCLVRWFWPDLMNGKHDHTTAVCVSLRSPGGLRVVQLPAGSWHGLPRW